MELGLKGKRVLVTAASRGIGRAIAIDFAKEGARVAAVARTGSEIFSLSDEMGGKEKGHYGQVIDLSAEGAPAKLVQSLKENFGPVDIVVHNLGGVLDIRDPLCSLADWRKVWRVNIEVAIELDQLLLPHMREQKWGRVVHIASTASM
jgi:3-oxoacyl-[acyl-carrier protein] reductase